MFLFGVTSGFRIHVVLFLKNDFVLCCYVQYVSLSSCICFGMSVILHEYMLFISFFFLQKYVSMWYNTMQNVIFCSDLQRTLHRDEWFLKEQFPASIRTNTSARKIRTRRPLGRGQEGRSQNYCISQFGVAQVRKGAYLLAGV